MQLPRSLLMAALAGVLTANTWVVAQEPASESVGPVDEEAAAAPTLEPTRVEPIPGDNPDPVPVIEPTPAPSPGQPTIVPPRAVPAQPAVPATPRARGRMPTLAPGATPATPAPAVVPYGTAPPATAPELYQQPTPYAPPGHPVPTPAPPGMSLRQRCTQCHSSGANLTIHGNAKIRWKVFGEGEDLFSADDLTPHGREAAKRDSAMFRLEHDDMVNDVVAHELAERFRQTKDEEGRAKLREEISAAITKHFEVRQERRKLELERLQKQIDELATSLERRQASRDAIIKRRLAELLGEDDELSF